MESTLIFTAAIVAIIIVAFTTKTEKEKNYVYESVAKSDNESGNKVNDESDDGVDYSTDWRTNYKNTLMETQKGTKVLFLETLTKIGCQYQVGEDDKGSIYFGYQGENFIAWAANDCEYVQLWDTHWEYIELYDIDEVSRLRKAINKANFNTAVTTVYAIDDVGKVMQVHSKSTIPFHSTMCDLDNYLRVELNEFFHAHQEVRMEMHKLREEGKCV